MRNNKVDKVNSVYWILKLVDRKLFISEIDAKRIRVELDVHPQPKQFLLNGKKIYTKDLVWLSDAQTHDNMIEGYENLEN